MEVSKEDFKIKGESFYLELIWDKVFKIVEHSQCFLIYQNNLSAVIILKKDLNPDEMIEIRNIFSQFSGIPVDIKKI
ncbi:MAG: YcxB family protein [Bacteroidota bacterium]